MSVYCLAPLGTLRAFKTGSRGPFFFIFLIVTVVGPLKKTRLRPA